MEFDWMTFLISKNNFKKKKGDYPAIQHLHKLIFSRIGKKGEVKKNLKKFSGIINEEDIKMMMARMNQMEAKPLRAILTFLNIPPGGKKEEMIPKLSAFVIEPSTKLVGPRAQRLAKKEKRKSDQREQSQKAKEGREKPENGEEEIKSPKKN